MTILSYAQLEGLWIAAGGPASVADVMAAISLAESGGNTGIVQQGQPPETTGWGLFQITPTSGQPGPYSRYLDPFTNASSAVALYTSGGFGQWSTYLNGAYRQFLRTGVKPVPWSGGTSGIGAAAGGAAAAVSVNLLPASLPQINYARRSTGTIDPSEWKWPHNAAGPALGELVTTESTVDFDAAQLPQIQLTVVDTDLSIYGSLAPLIAPGVSEYTGPQGRYMNEVLTVAEVQTTNVNDVPATIITMRPAFLNWLSTQWNLRVWGGMSATQWLEEQIAAYNAQLNKGQPVTTFTGQKTAVRGSITLNTNFAYTNWMSHYDLAMQLAMQEGFWLFESAGGVYFGEPPWLRTNVSTVIKVGWPGGGRMADDVDVECIGPPVILRSNVLYTGDTMTLYLPRDVGEQVRPGMGISLSGVPFASDDGPRPYPYGWIVQRVQYALDGGATTVEVDCNQAHYVRGTEPGGIEHYSTTNPNANNPPSDRVSNLPTGGKGATANEFVAKAASQIGVPYVWGASSPSTGFDCSGLVMWALSQLGINFPHYTGSQYQVIQNAGLTCSVAEARTVRGALVFAPNSSGVAGEHVAISLGNGTQILEAPFTGEDVKVTTLGSDWSFFDVAGFVPGLDYAPNAVKIHTKQQGG